MSQALKEIFSSLSGNFFSAPDKIFGHSVPVMIEIAVY